MSSTATKNETKIIAEPGKQDITIIREFEAPRELVFRAYTEPELYVRWLGPRGYEIEFEVRALERRLLALSQPR